MQKITTEKIRVRFLRNEADALQLDGSLINPRYGRPKRILKYIKWMTYSVQEDGKSVDKEKVVEVWYTSMVKGSSFKLDPKTFITEWKKGPTPTPKPLQKYNDEQLLSLNYTYDQIEKIRNKPWRSKDVTFLKAQLKFTYKKCKSLLEEYGNVKTILDLPEAKELLIKKEKLKLYHKKQKPKVKRGTRETKRQMLDTLRRKYLAERKEAKRLARIEKETPKVETT